MSFIYLDEEMRQEATKKERDLRRIVERYREWRKLHPEQPEGMVEGLRDWWGFRQWKGQRERERKLLERLDRKMFEEHIPPDIQEAIRQLEGAGMLPAQQPELGIGGWIREAFKDIGFLTIFFVFVLVGSMYLGQRTMFYVLSLILLSIIIVNADKLKRLLVLLRVI